MEPDHERFHKCYLGMIDTIHDAIAELHAAGRVSITPEMVTFIRPMVANVDPRKSMQQFITSSHETCWDHVKTRNTQELLLHANDIVKGLFSGGLPIDVVSIFKTILEARHPNGTLVVSADIIDGIWESFEALIKIALKYIHNGRNPHTCLREVKGAKVPTKVYGAKFFDDVNMAHHVPLWGVKLDFPPNY